MTAPTINQQLQEVYQPYLDHLYRKEWSVDEKISAPLLMHVFDDYATVPKKIMFVGQETHSWGGMINAKPSLQSLLQLYQDFEYGKHYIKNGKAPRILSSPFWNFIRSSFSRINARPRHTNGFLWTNISKFDSEGTTPSGKLQEQNPEGFYLLKDEIAITKPDIVVFLTGEKYNDRIDAVFNAQRKPLPGSGLLCSLKTTDGSLPLAFQTKHPRTLCQEKTYRGVLDELVAYTKE